MPGLAHLQEVVDRKKSPAVSSDLAQEGVSFHKIQKDPQAPLVAQSIKARSIVTHQRSNDHLDYAASHFAKTTPAPIPVHDGIIRAVALPPSILGPR